MGSVQSGQELEQFFTFIFEDQEGLVYTATKDPNTEQFEQYFFSWPTEKSSLIQHVNSHSPTKEVYYGPSLVKDKSGKKESFKGTNVVWCEFDGKVPSSLDSVPEPQLKLQSSTEGHEHWYWKLEYFETEPETVEKISRRIAYHLQADLGCWNSNRILRPPGTIHHESKNETRILRWEKRPTVITAFAELPEVPFRVLSEGDFRYIPDAPEVFLKYAFPQEAIELYKQKEIPKGHRSSAVTKLSHFCIEMGMTNSETLSILLSADDRWGKYKRRKDRRERLIGIINFCRAQHPVDPVEEEVRPEVQVYTFEEFMNTELKFEWVVEGFLHKKGLFCISGPPGVGKSQLTIRLMEKLAKEEAFLKWKVLKPQKTLFVSLEMPHEELLEFFRIMDLRDPQHKLRENFLILPVGHGIKLNNRKVQEDINATIEKFQPDGVIFDSFGRAIGGDLSSDKVVLDAMEYIDRTIRGEYGAFAGFIHHNRKEQIGNKKPKNMDDLYGSQYFAASVTSIMGLWPYGSLIEASCLKMRMAEEFSPFKLKRTPNLDFEVVENKPITGSIFGKEGNPTESTGGLDDRL